MINRLPTAPTNPSTTCRQPSLPQTQPPTTLWTDVYDQSSDPDPSGFGGYADPYVAVRVSLATSTTAPPSDEPYTGYR
ncbi:hypothetical protein M405DRAFT_826401 [Rhizopogon salebrosus TDB-379]|nr:hypothetical protein M405DRAFT_826401 [Rhizopogon salebrosus TDB-379]